MYANLTIAAVIPAFNEERLIGRTLSTIPTFVDRVIVVDDASSDRTVTEALAAGGRRLQLVRHPKNRGVGAAIATGYRESLALGCDIAVVMGGDAQMDPEEMDRLVEPIALGRADYVKGNRLSHPELQSRMPRSRLLGNRVLSAATRMATGAPDLRDSQCGYTAISRQALLALDLDRLWPRYGYPNDLLGHLYRAGLRVAQRPVTPIYGEEQSGIRAVTAIPTFSFLLARSWVRRMV